MDWKVLGAGALFMGAVAVHLSVLARAMPFRVDFNPEETFWQRWSWYLNLSTANGLDPARYTHDGQRWIRPIRITSLLAGLTLILFVIAIMVR